MRLGRYVLPIAGALTFLPFCSAGEGPFFITYTHQMEEPRNLEIATKNVTGRPRGGNRFLGAATEFEYGVTGWWTTEFYLDGQATRGDSALFTGYRWENRFRPFMREHWINPVVYVEFENLNGADRTFREVVGFDAESAEPNHEARLEKEREIETKLILSSSYKGWNIAENVIAVKNLSSEPWEFGYAVAVSRPLALAASARPCSFCRENLTAGVELYGGLGDRYAFGLAGTSQYVAPVLAWDLPTGVTLRVSPTFGLTDASHRFLLRFGAAYEIGRLGSRVKGMFR